MHPLADPVRRRHLGSTNLASFCLPACGSEGGREREGGAAIGVARFGPSVSLAARPSTRGPPPLLRGLRHNGDYECERFCVFLSRDRSVSLIAAWAREPGRKVFQKPIRAKRASRRFRSLRRARKSARPRLPPVFFGAQKLAAPQRGRDGSRSGASR